MPGSAALCKETTGGPQRPGGPSPGTVEGSRVNTDSWKESRPNTCEGGLEPRRVAWLSRRLRGTDEATAGRRAIGAEQTDTRPS